MSAGVRVSVGVDMSATCTKGHSGAKSASDYLQVVKNAFSWRFHFSAYGVYPDKSFWCGKKSS